MRAGALLATGVLLVPAVAAAAAPGMSKDMVCANGGGRIEAVRAYCGNARPADLVTLGDADSAGPLPGSEGVLPLPAPRSSAPRNSSNQDELPGADIDIVSEIANGNIARSAAEKDRLARDKAAVTRSKHELNGLGSAVNIPLTGSPYVVGVRYRMIACGNQYFLAYNLNPGGPVPSVPLRGTLRFGSPPVTIPIAARAQVDPTSRLSCGDPQKIRLGTVDQFKHLLLQHEFTNGHKVWSLDSMIEHLLHTGFLDAWPAKVTLPTTPTRNAGAGGAAGSFNGSSGGKPGGAAPGAEGSQLPPGWGRCPDGTLLPPAPPRKGPGQRTCPQ